MFEYIQIHILATDQFNQLYQRQKIIYSWMIKVELKIDYTIRTQSKQVTEKWKPIVWVRFDDNIHLIFSFQLILLIEK